VLPSSEKSTMIDKVIHLVLSPPISTTSAKCASFSNETCEIKASQ